jgi:Calcineurin-like phosphoesterase
MTCLERQSYLVIPDTHGEYEKVARVIDAFEPTVDRFLFLGDVIDGPDSRSLIRLIRGLGDKAITIVGNHEWVCRNALAASGEPEIGIWRKDVWPGYEDRMLESYGVKRTSDWQMNAGRLQETMMASGDLDWLNELPPYFETSDFVALHAGPIDAVPWMTQREDLDELSSDKARCANEPEQIFSRGVAGIPELSQLGDNRLFVTGHSHLSLPVEGRITRNRIRLASNLGGGEPLFVWLSGDKEVSRFD